MAKPIVIFRTKGEILTARDMGSITLLDDVIQNGEFKVAKMTDLLGFKIISGSNYKAIDVTSVQNNPRAFLELAFGGREVNEKTENQ